MAFEGLVFGLGRGVREGYFPPARITTAHEDYPLFRKVYEMSVWLTGRFEHFPTSQRLRLGSRLLDLCFELLSLVVEALHASESGGALQ